MKSDLNPYTCRTLLRVDYLIYRFVKRRPMYWSNDGALCERMPKGHGVERLSHFPGWMFILASNTQNRWPWTRKALSL